MENRTIKFEFTGRMEGFQLSVDGPFRVETDSSSYSIEDLGKELIELGNKLLLEGEYSTLIVTEE